MVLQQCSEQQLKAHGLLSHRLLQDYEWQHLPFFVWQFLGERLTAMWQQEHSALPMAQFKATDASREFCAVQMSSCQIFLLSRTGRTTRFTIIKSAREKKPLSVSIVLNAESRASAT